MTAEPLTPDELAAAIDRLLDSDNITLAEGELIERLGADLVSARNKLKNAEPVDDD